MTQPIQKPNQKHGCVCGWIGKLEDLVDYRDGKICPRCFRNGAAIRYTQPLIPCPQCDRGVSRIHVVGDRLYYCDDCRMQFDNRPEEGGDYSNNPTRRIEWEEAKRMRELARRAGARRGERR